MNLESFPKGASGAWVKPGSESAVTIENLASANVPEEPVKDPEQGSALPVEVTPEPDPSRVYGYVALVDPATGVKHLAHDADDPTMTLGYPNTFILTFRSTDGSTSAECNFGSGAFEVVRREGVLSYEPANNGGFAWYYDILLNADRSEGRPRVGGPVGVVASARTTGIASYNPDNWHFESVSTEFVDLPDPNGNTYVGQRRVNRVQLAPCKAPFPDLPDVE